MNGSILGSDACSPQSAKRSGQLLVWVFIWTATMVLADKAMAYGWYTAQWITVGAIALNAALGVGMIVFFISYLRSMDELQRKIQLEALAFAMGCGLVGSFTYSLLVTAGFIAESEISDIILLMTLTYMAAIITGKVRYR